MPHLNEPDLGLALSIGLEPELTQKDSIERLSSNFDVEYLTDERLNSDRNAAGHFFVTMIHCCTGEEKAVDLLLYAQGIENNALPLAPKHK